MTDAALLEERPMTYLPLIHADGAAHTAAWEEELGGLTMIVAASIEGTERWAAKVPRATVGTIEVRPIAVREMPV